MKKMLIIAALLSTSPAFAAPRLWENVEFGMTVAQVRSVRPDASRGREWQDIHGYRFLPNCPSPVRIMHPSGRVTSVQVHGSGVWDRCTEAVPAALIQRYGNPRERAFGTDRFGEYEATTWEVDGLSIRLVRRRVWSRPSGWPVNPTWIITYAPIGQDVMR